MPVDDFDFKCLEKNVHPVERNARYARREIHSHQNPRGEPGVNLKRPRSHEEKWREPREGVKVKPLPNSIAISRAAPAHEAP